MRRLTTLFPSEFLEGKPRYPETRKPGPLRFIPPAKILTRMPMRSLQPPSTVPVARRREESTGSFRMCPALGGAPHQYLHATQPRLSTGRWGLSQAGARRRPRRQHGHVTNRRTFGFAGGPPPNTSLVGLRQVEDMATIKATRRQCVSDVVPGLEEGE